MIEQKFSAKNFGFLSRRGDYWDYFKETPEKDSKTIRAEVLQEVENNVDVENYNFQPLHSFKIDKKWVYSLPRILKNNSNRLSVISDDYVLRQINRNLQRIYKVKQADRFRIISNVQTLLSNSTPFHVCQLDIKLFYESINRQKILKDIKNSAMVSYQTKTLLEKFFSNPSIKQRLPDKGLPRGINISATLAEYCLKKFDKKVSSMGSIYYYARFVDDIIIFSTEEITDQAIEEIASHLPPGLEFNAAKEGIHDFSEDVDDCISYLGYEFKISRKKSKGNKSSIKINTRIAKKKMNKIKRKLLLAFLDYKTYQDLKLLKDRLLFLTANYPLKTRREKFSRYEGAGSLHGGILYSYPLIDDFSCLSELDTFLWGLLFSKNMKKRMDKTLTDDQRIELKKFSFLQGYNRRIFRKFNQEHINRIVRCWR